MPSSFSRGTPSLNEQWGTFSLFREDLFWQHGNTSVGRTDVDSTCQTYSLVIREMWPKGVSPPRWMLWPLSYSVSSLIEKERTRSHLDPKGRRRMQMQKKCRLGHFCETGSQYHECRRCSLPENRTSDSSPLWNFTPASWLFQIPFLGTSHLEGVDGSWAEVTFHPGKQSADKSPSPVISQDGKKDKSNQIQLFSPQLAMEGVYQL